MEQPDLPSQGGHPAKRGRRFLRFPPHALASVNGPGLRLCVCSSPTHQAILTPRDCASLLGLVHHGATVSPEGNFLSIRLQHSLNDAIRDGLRANRRSRLWWRTKCVKVPIHSMNDVRAIRRTLDNNQYHPHWCRPIGHLIPREPRMTIVADAANEALGGSAWFSSSCGV
jgi:hypothetical protein